MLEIPGFYNLDCMEGMKEFPDKFFELAIVDPPSGVELNKKGTSWTLRKPSHEYFQELYRVSVHQIIWGCNFFPGEIPGPGRIVFNKLLSGGPVTQLRSDCELASQSLTSQIDLFSYQWNGSLQNGKPNWKNDGWDARIHPTQKPIALYEWTLNKYGHAGDKILDTHVGSGSSLVACEELGFSYVGFEIDKDYFTKALYRLKECRRQTQLAI